MIVSIEGAADVQRHRVLFRHRYSPTAIPPVTDATGVESTAGRDETGVKPPLGRGQADEHSDQQLIRHQGQLTAGGDGPTYRRPSTETAETPAGPVSGRPPPSRSSPAGQDGKLPPGRG